KPEPARPLARPCPLELERPGSREPGRILVIVPPPRPPLPSTRPSGRPPPPSPSLLAPLPALNYFFLFPFPPSSPGPSRLFLGFPNGPTDSRSVTSPHRAPRRPCHGTCSSWIHAHRAPRRHRDYRGPHRTPTPGRSSGPRGGAAVAVREQSQAVGPCGNEL